MKIPYDLVWATLLLIPAASCTTMPSAPNDATSSDTASRPAPSLAEGVTGVVTDESGKPVEGAMIVPTSREAGGPPIPEIAILSATDGRYRWPLRPGRYDVTVRAEGYEDVTRQVTVTAGSVATLDFVVGRN
jgi:hypothetical protein